MSAANRVFPVSAKPVERIETSRPEKDPEQFATAFGLLTRAEIREWEKMLGRRLLRLPDHSPSH
jgi:hypothetical protein